MDKLEQRKIKEQQKKYSKLLKKCGAKRSDSPAQIDDKLIAYLKSLKSKKLYEIQLDEQHLTNPEFLIKAYSNIPELTFWLKPQSKDLINDFDFMLEYLKLTYAYELSKQTGKFPTHKEYHLIWQLRDYQNLFTSVYFLKLLNEKLPDLNLIFVLRECFEDTYFECDKFRKIEYRNLLLKLPKEVLINQARMHGVEALKIMPKTFDFYPEIISAGIEKDGFKALAYLDASQVIANKALIKKAYIYGGGAEALKDYLHKTLEPYYITCDNTKNPPRERRLANQKKLAVQQQLLNDKEIKEMLPN